jgi:ribosomal protein S12 methylthiotransferase
MAAQADISAAKLRRRIGRRMTVLVDEISDEGIIARSRSDAPEIDGVVVIKSADKAKAGELIEVEITDADEHDLYARFVHSH